MNKMHYSWAIFQRREELPQMSFTAESGRVARELFWSLPVGEDISYTFLQSAVTCNVISSPKIYRIFLDLLEKRKLPKSSKEVQLFYFERLQGLLNCLQLWVGAGAGAMQRRICGQGKVLATPHLSMCSCPRCLTLKLLLRWLKFLRLNLQACKITPLLLTLLCKERSSVIWLDSLT